MGAIKVEEYRIKKNRKADKWTVTIVSTQNGVTVKTQSEGRTYAEAVALARSKEMDRRIGIYQLQFPELDETQLRDLANHKPPKKTLKLRSED